MSSAARSSLGATPALSWTKALTCSPISGSGLPTTATSKIEVSEIAYSRPVLVVGMSCL